MPTTFVLHPAATETTTDGLTAWPVYDYTAVSVALAGLARDGTSPTLDVKLQAAPLTGDEDYWSDVTSGAFAQLTSGDSLPTSESLGLTLTAGNRYVRLYQTIGGSDSPSWIYRLVATIVLFDITNAEHTDLLPNRVGGYSDLSDLAEVAEDDVVRRYMQDGVLMLAESEDTGSAIRRAIAARITWLLERQELKNSGKRIAYLELRQHSKDEWRGVDRYLRAYDQRVPLVM